MFLPNRDLSAKQSEMVTPFFVVTVQIVVPLELSITGLAEIFLTVLHYLCLFFVCKSSVMLLTLVIGKKNVIGK